MKNLKNLKKVISVTFFVTFFLGLSAQNYEAFYRTKTGAFWEKRPTARLLYENKNDKKHLKEISSLKNVEVRVTKGRNIISFVKGEYIKGVTNNLLEVPPGTVIYKEGSYLYLAKCGNRIATINRIATNNRDDVNNNKNTSSNIIDIKKKKIVRSKNTTINNGSNGSGGCTSGIRLQDNNNNPVNGGGGFGNGNNNNNGSSRYVSDCDKSISDQYPNQNLSLMFANSQTYNEVKRFAPNKHIANQYLACKFPTAYKTRKVLKVVGIVGGVLITGYSIYRGIKYLKNDYVNPTPPDYSGRDPIPDPTNVDPTGPGGNYFTGTSGLRINWGG